MTNLDLISLLEGLILSHENLKEQDKPVVKKLCKLIRIQEQGLINQYHQQQVEAEAGAVYLKGKYDAIIDKFRTIIDKHKAGKFVELGSRDDEGLKWTKPGKEQWLLGTDAKYSMLLDRLKNAERLLTLLKELSTIVFSRDRKLEQLSINYRRETEADKRTSY